MSGLLGSALLRHAGDVIDKDTTAIIKVLLQSARPFAAGRSRGR